MKHIKIKKIQQQINKILTRKDNIIQLLSPLNEMKNITINIKK